MSKTLRSKVHVPTLATDLRGAAQLTTQATLGITRLTEGVHQSVWGTVGVPGGKPHKGTASTRGITGLVYSAVRGVTQLVGKTADTVLARLTPLLESADAAPKESDQRVAVLAALNGVLGDHLHATRNPLAARMTLRYRGHVLDWKAQPLLPGATQDAPLTGKVLVIIHGLCMNDLQWTHTDEAGVTHNHGDALAAAQGYTPVYVRYNTGLHTSQNGAEFSRQLTQLVSRWPVPITEISVLAHSMGGLVTRSAAAQADAPAWLPLLKNIVFLGTPHHGAPLERAGNWVDVILGSTPYSRPFAKLGQLRSAGITDLRYGHVLESDWKGHERFRRKPDSRTHVPLPEGVNCFTVAATVAKPRSLLAERLVGDGLVPLHSALGLHDVTHRNLNFPKSRQAVVYRANHMDLLWSPVVRDQLLTWLG